MSTLVLLCINKSHVVSAVRHAQIMEICPFVRLRHMNTFTLSWAMQVGMNVELRAIDGAKQVEVCDMLQPAGLFWTEYPSPYP